MQKYHKIETVFNRDMNGTKRLIDGSYRNPTIEYLKDNLWVMTEKIDGTNISICWDGHNITFNGRTENAQIPKHLLYKLTKIFKNTETEEIFEQKFGEQSVILFGEGYGYKIQNGGNYIQNDVSFILFDVLINGNWQPRESVEDIAKSFNIEVVPILFTGTLQQGIDFVKTNPKSTIGTADMEGVVAKPLIEMRDRCGDRVVVKIKYCDFK